MKLLINIGYMMVVEERDLLTAILYVIYRMAD